MEVSMGITYIRVFLFRRIDHEFLTIEIIEFTNETQSAALGPNYVQNEAIACRYTKIYILFLPLLSLCILKALTSRNISQSNVNFLNSTIFEAAYSSTTPYKDALA